MVNSRAEVLRILGEQKTELAKFGIVRVGVFGSAARDELGPDSDVDVLVEFAAGQANMVNFMDAKFLLENSLGRRVDLATPRSVNKPILWASITQDLVYAS